MMGGWRCWGIATAVLSKAEVEKCVTSMGVASTGRPDRRLLRRKQQKVVRWVMLPPGALSTESRDNNKVSTQISVAEGDEEESSEMINVAEGGRSS
ncbi:hypothetical protein OPV22_010395 [Ensete ventricosum]|uniref:Uncharacterized protein n=1 Tax=Ensete ventricosum TaxID=4639 RepID=A0AAV8RL43_ENSVE|nr:hypothetical protein OPV22_010395 [Ensete ventricosum]